MTDHLAPYVTHCIARTVSRDGPLEIVLRYPAHVVVAVCYSDDIETVELLAPLDHNGEGLAKLPVELVTRWYTAEEAEQDAACRDIDDQLLSYAR